jgi:hypothetical protein
MKLDTLLISEDARAFAEATFMKKRMYYNMRIKTIQRNTSNVIKLLKCSKMIRMFKSDIVSTKLNKRIYEIKRELEERRLLPPVSKGNLVQFNSEATNPLDNEDQAQLMDDLDTKCTSVTGKLHDQND